MQWVTLFFASNLVLFLLALQAGLHIGIVYFLWLGIFNVMVIAQFWAFAADLYTEEQGKRLFPLIGVGSSLGAWLGSVRAGPARARAWGRAAARRRRRDPGRLRAAGARRRPRHARAATPQAIRARRREARRPDRAASADLLGSLSDAHCRARLLLNVVNTSGEYLFGRYVVKTGERCTERAPRGGGRAQQFIGESYSSYFSYINLVGFLLQLFVVSRVFKFLGVGRSLLRPPDRRLVGYL